MDSASLVTLLFAERDAFRIPRHVLAICPDFNTAAVLEYVLSRLESASAVNGEVTARIRYADVRKLGFVAMDSVAAALEELEGRGLISVDDWARPTVFVVKLGPKFMPAVRRWLKRGSA